MHIVRLCSVATDDREGRISTTLFLTGLFHTGDFCRPCQHALSVLGLISEPLYDACRSLSNAVSHKMSDADSQPDRHRVSAQPHNAMLPPVSDKS